MMDFATSMMKGMMEKHKVPSLEQLIQQAKDLEIKLYPCQTAMTLFGYTVDDLIEDIEKPAGAATFLSFVNAGDKSIVLNF
jgi:peroxiredoxin family protein